MSPSTVAWCSSTATARYLGAASRCRWERNKSASNLRFNGSGLLVLSRRGMAGRVLVVQRLAVGVALWVVAARIGQEDRRCDAFFQLDGLKAFLGLLCLNGVHEKLLRSKK